MKKGILRKSRSGGTYGDIFLTNIHAIPMLVFWSFIPIVDFGVFHEWYCILLKPNYGLDLPGQSRCIAQRLWNLVFLSCTYWSLIGFSIFKILCINAMASPVRWYPSIVSNFGRWLMSLATIIGVREVSEWYDKFTHLLK